ncbi:MAG: phospholipid carrier-dependent glycosyltransferase, partial [Victivallaceae bacterium]
MKKYYIGLIALFIVIYILPLGVRPMIAPDEYRYAEIPREMLLSNDWVVPRLAGVRYFEKPVMGYWLNAISIMLFGENGFAVRLPSALATGLAAFFIWWLVRAKSREDEPALLAAALFLTFGMVFGIGTFAVLDAPTAMFITGALVFFFLADMEKKFNWKKVALLALFGVFCGLAFMTKGFIAFAVPAVVIAPYMIWEKRWKELLILPWIPIVAAV